MQKRQMNTQEGGNVSVCAIEGNFDDAQTGVKKLFVNHEINEKLNDNGMLFSSANSINWGRLLPQIVYYFSAYSDMVAQGTIALGDKINVVVPTGNFGNILAGYYASKMGLPVNKFICASNSNNVLTDFLKTGEYNRNRPFHATISPSMDILISSNLERLLYDVTGHSCAKVGAWMTELNEKGSYKVDDETFAKITAAFDAGFCGEENTLKTVRKVYDNANYLCDTHTAVAIEVYEDYVSRTGDKTPSVIVSTASPYKFASSVLNAVDDSYDDTMDEFQKVARLSSLTKTEVPAPIASLEQKTVRFQNVCAKENMGDELLKMVGLQ
jgi:threonine synthase